MSPYVSHCATTGHSASPPHCCVGCGRHPPTLLQAHVLGDGESGGDIHKSSHVHIMRIRIETVISCPPPQCSCPRAHWPAMVVPLSASSTFPLLFMCHLHCCHLTTDPGICFRAFLKPMAWVRFGVSNHSSFNLVISDFCCLSLADSLELTAVVGLSPVVRHHLLNHLGVVKMKSSTNNAHSCTYRYRRTHCIAVAIAQVYSKIHFYTRCSARILYLPHSLLVHAS